MKGQGNLFEILWSNLKSNDDYYSNLTAVYTQVRNIEKLENCLPTAGHYFLPNGATSSAAQIFKIYN